MRAAPGITPEAATRSPIPIDTPSMADDTLIVQTALTYARHGVPVCPTVPDPSKKPRFGVGSRTASTDPAMIRRWWRLGPTSNLAVVTGEAFDVLDVDVKNGQPGFASLHRLADAGLLAGSGRMVRTPSGGLHVYFLPSGRGPGALPGTGLELKAPTSCARCRPR